MEDTTKIIISENVANTIVEILEKEARSLVVEKQYNQACEVMGIARIMDRQIRNKN